MCIILFLLAKNLKSNWKTDLNFGKKFSKRWYTQRCVNGLGKAESPKATTEKINIKQSNSEILLVYKDENDPIIEFYYSFVWSCWHNSERREKLYKTSWQLGDGRFCFPSSVFGCTLLPFGYKSSTAARTETRGGGELGEQPSNGATHIPRSLAQSANSLALRFCVAESSGAVTISADLYRFDWSLLYLPPL